jgi:hypothetical protein
LNINRKSGGGNNLATKGNGSRWKALSGRRAGLPRNPAIGEMPVSGIVQPQKHGISGRIVGTYTTAPHLDSTQVE